MARPLSPIAQRLTHISYGHGQSLYVAQFSGGIVKVGYSANPRHRIKKLAGYVQRNFGATLERFHVSGPITSGTKLEAKLLRRMFDQFQPIPGHREYFRDVSFFQAAFLLEDTVAQAA